MDRNTFKAKTELVERARELKRRMDALAQRPPPLETVRTVWRAIAECDWNGTPDHFKSRQQRAKLIK